MDSEYKLRDLYSTCIVPLLTASGLPSWRNMYLTLYKMTWYKDEAYRGCDSV
jgi:hypothetical protein